MYVRKNNNPTNEKLWNKAQELSAQKFHNPDSVYARLWAKKWYKENGGGWNQTTNKKPDEKNQEQKQNKSQLLHFETYVDDDKNEDKDKQNKNKATEEAKAAFWLRESWVDISRPVLDEAGNVIGFHPCGNNTKELNSFVSNYRTSYPRCMPRSKAMKLTAMEREKMLQSNRHLQQQFMDTQNYSPEEDE